MTEDHVTDEHAHDHAHEHGPRGTDAAPRLSPRLSRGIATTLAVVAAIALVAIVVELVVLRPRYQEARADERARTEVAQVAEQFAVQVNNYDTGSIDDYQETVRSLLTTKFAGEFEKAMGDIVTSVNEAQMSSQGKVLTSAVASVDPDSADGAGGGRRQRQDGLRHPRPALPLGGLAGQGRRDLAGRQLHAGHLSETGAATR